MTGRLTALLAGLVALVLLPMAAWAHKPSDSYLRLARADANHINAQWDIALRDLEEAIGLDADGDGAITWGELRQRRADVEAYAFARLSLKRAGLDCTPRAGELLVDEHSDGHYAVLRFAFECPAAAAQAAGNAADTLQLTYKLLAELDPLHRGLLSLAGGVAAQGSTSAVLDPNAGPRSFELRAPDRLRQFIDFARDGVWHIWIGLDHILFLLSLLLPAVLAWSAAERRWLPVGNLRAALVDVVKVVTAFTLAHSITLSLATLGVVALPSAWVESTIAASVVAAALNNIWPLFHGRRWLVAFAFGLIHGFGFASVLADLGLPSDALLLALVAFNLGVEAGQLAIVVVFVPLAFALRARRLYNPGLLKLGSAAIAVLALVWLWERAAPLLGAA